MFSILHVAVGWEVQGTGRVQFLVSTKLLGSVQRGYYDGNPSGAKREIEKTPHLFVTMR
jgi:hypothetical protein